MASTNIMRMTDAGPPVAARGTFPSAANQLFPKGTIVTMNATGFAVSPGTGDTSGFPAMGVSNHTFDNRTGAEAGGGAGDLDIEVVYGVFGFDIDGTTPLPGQILYVVDNQTVSVADTGGRGVAGICSEVRDGQAYLRFSPNAGALSDILAAIAAV